MLSVITRTTAVDESGGAATAIGIRPAVASRPARRAANARQRRRTQRIRRMPGMVLALRHVDAAGLVRRTRSTRILRIRRRTLATMLPETRYARRAGLHLAFQVLGEGPPDLLLLDQWFSHMEAQWEVPPVAEFRERLASFGRLIMYDKRGSGLSDPIPTAQLPTIEEWMDDVPIVLAAAGSERAVIIANLGGGMMAATYAAAHPERVAGLVLVDCFARFTEAPDYAFGAAQSEV